VNDLPKNLELEAQVLGMMLAHNETIDTVADILKAEDFAEPLHQRIYASALSQHSTAGVTNPATLHSLFRDDPAIKELGGPAYLMQLTATPVGMLDPRGFATQLADTGRRRRIVEGLRGAIAAASDAHSPISDAIGLADDAIGERVVQAVKDHSAEDCFDQMLAGYGRETRGVTCGRIKCLDEAMGALAPGSMNVIAARPGMGKTAVALSYAIGAAEQGYGVLLVSLEMPGEQLAQRMAADMLYDTLRVPYERIRDGKLDDHEFKAIQRAKHRVGELPLRIATGSSLAVGRLASLIRRTKRRFKAHGGSLDLVMIDYLQLLKTDVRLKSEYESISEISTALKSMAMDNEVALIALAQLSREVEKRDNKRPVLSDLRSSGQIEQDADVVLFLLREEYYLLKDEPPRGQDKWAEWQMALAEVRDKIRFICAKRRNGVEGTQTGQFYGEFQAVRG
jgi:replicative DNA helicase